METIEFISLFLGIVATLVGGLWMFFKQNRKYLTGIETKLKDEMNALFQEQRVDMNNKIQEFKEDSNARFQELKYEIHADSGTEK
ncbi:MAG: hypothetical protein LBB90_00775 [Tannerella sp.]|jgi:gas vesicle protein|nr:hypothetical protein [Tannerella sp.]